MNTYPFREPTRQFEQLQVALVAAVDERDDALAEVERLRAACVKQDNAVGQTIAQALGGFPWYKDDKKNFPDATEADGVCVGEHTAETLAEAAAKEIKRLRAIVDKLPKTADGVTVVPGEDTVWAWHPHRGEFTEYAVEISQPYAEVDYDFVDPNCVCRFYSTREAAEAAKEQR